MPWLKSVLIHMCVLKEQLEIYSLEWRLRDKIINWKAGMEVKGLKMNTRKTKVMFSCSTSDRVEEQGKLLCGFLSTESAVT